MRRKEGLIYLSDRSGKPDKPSLKRVFWVVAIFELLALLRWISFILGHQTTEEFFKLLLDSAGEFVTNLTSTLASLSTGHGAVLDNTLALCCILAGIIFLLLLIFNPKLFLGAVKEACFQLFLGRSSKPDVKDAELSNRVTICDALREYSDMIYQLCFQAGIKDVNFVAGKGGNIVSGEVTYAIKDAFDHNPKQECATFEATGFVPTIYVDLDFMDKLRLYKNIAERDRLIRFVFSHELIHVRNHDPMNLRYKWGIGGLLWLGAVVFVYDLFFLSIGNDMSVIVKAAVVLAELLLLVFGSVLVDKGYWIQCQEFRADRLAAAISNDDTASEGRETSVFDTFEDTFGVFETEEKDARAFDWLWSLGKTVIWFCTEGEVFAAGYETHPSVKARKKELVRGERWGVYDYLRYAVVIRLRAVNGKSKKVA